MQSVYLIHASNLAVSNASVLQFEHALKRRMTWMQLAVMECFEQLRVHRPHLHAAVWGDAIPIYFATAFGELASALKVMQSVFTDQLPVSPTAFQHSVHNCAPAYLTMAQKSHHPTLTISNGCLSFDKGLFLAQQKIRCGITSAAVVVGGKDLLTATDSALGEGEICILGNEQMAAAHRASHKLRRFIHSGLRPSDSHLLNDLEPDFTQQHWDEGAQHWQTLPLLPVDSSFHRIVVSQRGETLVSTWEAQT